jgi:hypothetical protein
MLLYKIIYSIIKHIKNVRAYSMLKKRLKDSLNIDSHYPLLKIFGKKLFITGNKYTLDVTDSDAVNKAIVEASKRILIESFGENIFNRPTHVIHLNKNTFN